MILTTTILLAALASAAPGPSAQGRLPIIADDYAKALSEAKERKVPLFVEVWAPW